MLTNEADFLNDKTNVLDVERCPEWLERYSDFLMRQIILITDYK